MSSSSGLYLPNEILEIIINELASDTEDKGKSLAALASCRFASHVLYSLATPRLFSSIRLTDSNNHGLTKCNILMKRAMKLNQILCVPHIAAAIRSLTVCFHHESLENSRSGFLMSTILYRLSHIQNFRLKVYGDDYFIFNSIPKDFALAIQALCRSSNLMTLALDKIQWFPFKAITACPNLGCLHLRCVDILDFDVIRRHETSSQRALYLDSLNIDMASICTLGQRISKDKTIETYFSRIKKLQLEDLFFYPLVSNYGWRIMLQTLQQNLTTLELVMGQGQRPELVLVLNKRPIDLSSFPALRHFKIQRRSSCRGNQTFIPFLTQLLSPSSSSSGIQTLEIGITWRGVKEGYGKNVFSSDAGWSTLDQLLISQKYGSLNKIILHLHLEMRKARSSEEGCERNDSNREHILKSERNLTIPYVNNLFPLFRALTRPILETHFQVG